MTDVPALTDEQLDEATTRLEAIATAEAAFLDAKYHRALSEMDDAETALQDAAEAFCMNGYAASILAAVRAERDTRQRVEAVRAVIDNENVPPADIRVGYQLALRAVQYPDFGQGVEIFGWAHDHDTLTPSEPTKPEAQHWQGSDAAESAAGIVQWVNAHGGEARYEPEIAGRFVVASPARIAVRRADGWVYASPGDWITKGQWFRVAVPYGQPETRVRDFSVSPEPPTNQERD